MQTRYKTISVTIFTQCSNLFKLPFLTNIGQTHVRNINSNRCLSIIKSTYNIYIHAIINWNTKRNEMLNCAEPKRTALFIWISAAANYVCMQERQRERAPTHESWILKYCVYVEICANRSHVLQPAVLCLLLIIPRAYNLARISLCYLSVCAFFACCVFIYSYSTLWRSS